MAHEVNGMPVVSGSHAPDVFVDEAASFELINGMVRISMSSIRMVDPAPPSASQHVIIGRLVMPIESAQRLAVGLFNYLKTQGLDPARSVVGDEKPN